MKTAVISDIHSNPAALNAVLKDAEDKGCNKVVCLGDIVGYGYDPNGCIDICREKGIECYMGNHDAGLVGDRSINLDWFNAFARKAILWQQGEVTEDNKKWLSKLPFRSMGRSSDGFHYAFAHGTYENPERFYYLDGCGTSVLELVNIRREGIKVLFVGHTHCAEIYARRSDESIIQRDISIEDEVIVNLNKYEETIINVGSVGYPRVQPYSIYGIFDDAEHTFRHRILPFDFEKYQKQMEECGAAVPLWLPSRAEWAKERPVLWK